MIAVLRKELRSCFSNMYGYILICAYLFFAGLFTSSVCLFGGSSSIELSYGYLSFIFMLAVPFLTMKGMSDERRQKTDTLLYSLPIGSFDIVLGKFLSMTIIMGICHLIGFAAVLILSFYGKINLISAIGGTIALFLCGCSLLSVGLFISTLSGSILISALLSFGAMLIIYFMPDLISFVPTTAVGSFITLTIIILLFSLLTGYLSNSFSASVAFFLILELLNITALLFFPDTEKNLAVKLFSFLSVTDKLKTFTIYAVFDIQNLIYFISFTALFIYFTYLSVEKRRWR